MATKKKTTKRPRNRRQEYHMQQLARIAQAHYAVRHCSQSDVPGAGEVNMPGRGRHTVCVHCLRLAEELLVSPAIVLYCGMYVRGSEPKFLSVFTPHGVPLGRVLTVTKGFNNFCRPHNRRTMLAVTIEDLHGQRWYGRGRGEGYPIKLHRATASRTKCVAGRCEHTRDLEEEAAREYEELITTPDPALTGNCETCGWPKIDHYYLADEYAIPKFEGCDEARRHEAIRAARKQLKRS